MAAVYKENLVPGSNAVRHVRSLIHQGASKRWIAHQARVSDYFVAVCESGKYQMLPFELVARVLMVKDVPIERRLVPAVGTTRRCATLFALGHGVASMRKWLTAHNEPSNEISTTLIRGQMEQVRSICRDGVVSLYEAMVETRPGRTSMLMCNQHMATWPEFVPVMPCQWEGVDVDDPDAEPLPICSDEFVDEVLVERYRKGLVPLSFLTPADRRAAGITSALIAV